MQTETSDSGLNQPEMINNVYGISRCIYGDLAWLLIRYQAT